MSELRMDRLHRGSVLALGALALITSGCEKMHYRDHDFYQAKVAVSDGIRVILVLSGTWVTSDSAGFSIERRANPYSILVFVDSSSTAAVEQVTVELTGLQSGAVLTPELSPLSRFEGDTPGTSVARAHDLELAYEDYTARFHIRIRDASGLREEERTTTLNQKFNQGWFYSWEKWTRH
jgi:hypothetical protein